MYNYEAATFLYYIVYRSPVFCFLKKESAIPVLNTHFL